MSFPQPSRIARAVDRIRGRIAATCAFPLEYARFRKSAASESDGRRPRIRDVHACLNDRTALTTFDRHYVYHPAWALRVLLETKPAEHVDISSILSFAAMASAIVPFRFFDFRPAALKLPGLVCDRADLMALPFADRSVSSLSCMHVIEHIGLGRYGDPIDARGDRRALAELQRVVAPGGTLLVVVPVGVERVCFNAHRVYDPATIVTALDQLRLRAYSVVPDAPYDAGLVNDHDFAVTRRQRYGCGCFRFERPAEV